eukprot:jgi/Ulvmu1/3160/UM015_0200.1
MDDTVNDVWGQFVQPLPPQGTDAAGMQNDVCETAAEDTRSTVAQPSPVAGPPTALPQPAGAAHSKANEMIAGDTFWVDFSAQSTPAGAPAALPAESAMSKLSSLAQRPLPATLFSETIPLATPALGSEAGLTAAAVQPEACTIATQASSTEAESVIDAQRQAHASSCTRGRDQADASSVHDSGSVAPAVQSMAAAVWPSEDSMRQQSHKSLGPGGATVTSPPGDSGADEDGTEEWEHFADVTDNPGLAVPVMTDGNIVTAQDGTFRSSPQMLHGSSGIHMQGPLPADLFRCPVETPAIAAVPDSDQVDGLGMPAPAATAAAGATPGCNAAAAVSCAEDLVATDSRAADGTVCAERPVGCLTEQPGSDAAASADDAWEASASAAPMQHLDSEQAAMAPAEGVLDGAGVAVTAGVADDAIQAVHAGICGDANPADDGWGDFADVDVLPVAVAGHSWAGSMQAGRGHRDVDDWGDYPGEKAHAGSQPTADAAQARPQWSAGTAAVRDALPEDWFVAESETRANEMHQADEGACGAASPEDTVDGVVPDVHVASAPVSLIEEGQAHLQEAPVDEVTEINPVTDAPQALHCVPATAEGADAAVLIVVQCDGTGTDDGHGAQQGLDVTASTNGKLSAPAKGAGMVAEVAEANDDAAVLAAVAQLAPIPVNSPVTCVGDTADPKHGDADRPDAVSASTPALEQLKIRDEAAMEEVGGPSPPLEHEAPHLSPPAAALQQPKHQSPDPEPGGSSDWEVVRTPCTSNSDWADFAAAADSPSSRALRRARHTAEVHAHELSPPPVSCEWSDFSVADDASAVPQVPCGSASEASEHPDLLGTQGPGSSSEAASPMHAAHAAFARPAVRDHAPLSPRSLQSNTANVLELQSPSDDEGWQGLTTVHTASSTAAPVPAALPAEIRVGQKQAGISAVEEPADAPRMFARLLTLSMQRLSSLSTDDGKPAARVVQQASVRRHLAERCISMLNAANGTVQAGLAEGMTPQAVIELTPGSFWSSVPLYHQLANHLLRHCGWQSTARRMDEEGAEGDAGARSSSGQSWARDAGDEGVVLYMSSILTKRKAAAETRRLTQILQAFKVPFEEVDLAAVPHRRSRMLWAAGDVRDLPQLHCRGRFIGTASTCFELHDFAELLPLLLSEPEDKCQGMRAAGAEPGVEGGSDPGGQVLLPLPLDVWEQLQAAAEAEHLCLCLEHVSVHEVEQPLHKDVDSETALCALTGLPCVGWRTDQLTLSWDTDGTGAEAMVDVSGPTGSRLPVIVAAANVWLSLLDDMPQCE